MLGSLAHICVAVAAASAPSSPLTFGGHVEGGQVCEGAPLVILNHTVSAAGAGGVLRYFWHTEA